MKRSGLGWMACLACVVLLGACKTRDTQHVGTPANPVVLMLSQAHARGLQPGDTDAMAQSLSTLCGMNVVVKAAGSTQEALAAFEGSKADLGLLTLAEYLLAHAHHGVNARLQLVRAAGSREYRGEVLMRKDGGLQPGSRLQGRKIAYVDPSSVSGYLLPALLLSDHELQIQFAGSHDEAVKRLLAGAVDLAAVYAGAAHDDALAVYATTLTMPNEPFFVRDGVEPALDATLVNALRAWVALPESQALALRLTGITGLEPIEDQPYKAAYQTLRGAGRFVEDLVPGGRALAWNNLSPIWAP